MSVCWRYRYWAVSVTPLPPSHACGSKPASEGRRHSPSLWGCCAIPLSTQASSVPAKLYFHHWDAYVTTALQFYSEPEHITWGWQFLTWDATDAARDLSFTCSYLQKLLALFYFFLNCELQGNHSTVTLPSELGAVPATSHIRPMTCVFCGMQLTPSRRVFSQRLNTACNILAVTGDGISVMLSRHVHTVFCCSDGDLWGTHLAYCLSPETKLHLLSTDFKQGAVQNHTSLWEWMHSLPCSAEDNLPWHCAGPWENPSPQYPYHLPSHQFRKPAILTVLNFISLWFSCFSIFCPKNFILSGMGILCVLCWTGFEHFCTLQNSHWIFTSCISVPNSVVLLEIVKLFGVCR